MGCESPVAQGSKAPAAGIVEDSAERARYRRIGEMMKPAYLLVALALACSPSTSSPSNTPDDSDSEIDPEAGKGLPEPAGPPAECLDENDNPIECDSDADCCEGFYCGLDPEGSTRIKTCVYGGG
jgi:hypothetical protein